MLVDNLSLGSQKKGFVGDRWIKMDIRNDRFGDFQVGILVNPFRCFKDRLKWW